MHIHPIYWRPWESNNLPPSPQCVQSEWANGILFTNNCNHLISTLLLNLTSIYFVSFVNKGHVFHGMRQTRGKLTVTGNHITAPGSSCQFYHLLNYDYQATTSPCNLLYILHWCTSVSYPGSNSEQLHLSITREAILNTFSIPRPRGLGTRLSLK